MSETPALRSSDADREQTVTLLREHSVEGRLTLEELTERIGAAYRARTKTELDELVRDLPATGAPAAVTRKATRFVFSIFGSSERDGRIRVHQRVRCVTVFGNVDLDLRQATLEGEVVTIAAFGLFGAIDVYVPEGVEVDLHGFALFGHKRANGNRPATAPRNASHPRLRSLGVRRHRCLASAARLGAEDLVRGDPRHPVREPPRAGCVT
jgi:hypothetical protein